MCGIGPQINTIADKVPQKGFKTMSSKSQNVAQEVTEVSDNRQYFTNRVNTPSSVYETFAAHVQKITAEVTEDSPYFMMLEMLKTGMETSLNSIPGLTKFDKAVEVIENINKQADSLLKNGTAMIELRQPDLTGIRTKRNWRDNSGLHDQICEVQEVAQVVELVFNYGDEVAEGPQLDADEIVKFLTGKGVVETIATTIANYAMKKLGSETEDRTFLIFSHKEVGGKVVPAIALTFASSLAEIGQKLSPMNTMSDYRKMLGEDEEDEEGTSETQEVTSEESEDVVASIA